METNEQWLLEGKCNLCRRVKYCSKPCTRNKRANRAEIQNLTANLLNEMTGGCMREIIDKSIMK